MDVGRDGCRVGPLHCFRSCVAVVSECEFGSNVKKKSKAKARLGVSPYYELDKETNVGMHRQLET